jgi:oligoendopeptidase F
MTKTTKKQIQNLIKNHEELEEKYNEISNSNSSFNYHNGVGEKNDQAKSKEQKCIKKMKSITEKLETIKKDITEQEWDEAVAEVSCWECWPYEIES